ncbi:MAG: RidA family protein [Ignavibacteriae bacterium]|nr:MAG: RidA family protein [Ignavibacteriota bacterium]
MHKTKYSSGAKWEDIVGYSRAVKVGNTVLITGTTAVDENGVIVAVNDAYNQARYIFMKIQKYLEQAGARLEDVVRNRIYVKDISKWEIIGKAHAEFFGEIKPCCTMVEVKKFVDKDMLVEVETEAIIINPPVEQEQETFFINEESNQ